MNYGQIIFHISQNSLPDNVETAESVNSFKATT